MKKRQGLERAVDAVALSELSMLTTGALLARLKRLRWCYETPDAASDYTQEELKPVQEQILFKSDIRWKNAYNDVKTLLDEREHKPNM